MKEHINVINDMFVDYKGIVHPFTIVAVSQTLPKNGNELGEAGDTYGNCEVTHEVAIYLEDYGTYDYLGCVGKVVKIGVAICNPDDDYNEKVGYNKALARARNSNPVLYANVNNLGIINTAVVEALLQQEAKYLKENPAKYIKGYKEAEEKYHLREKMLDIYDNFSSLEDDVLEALTIDPHYFDDVHKYIEWAKKQQEESED